MPFGGNSFYNVKKERKDKGMAITVQRFIKLANYYNQTAMLMSAICVQKGGIAMENYVGRFYVADVLEYVLEYGRRLQAQNKNVAPEIVALINRLAAQFERVKDLTTPTQKPIHEMTLEECEKIMNVYYKLYLDKGGEDEKAWNNFVWFCCRVDLGCLPTAAGSAIV